MMTATTIEERASQREHARQLANHVRLSRADLKRKVRAGTVDVREVILAPPDFAGRMDVDELLCALPRVGHTTVDRITRGICRSNLQLQHMGDYTRGRLVASVAERVWWAMPHDA